MHRPQQEECVCAPQRGSTHHKSFLPLLPSSHNSTATQNSPIRPLTGLLERWGLLKGVCSFHLTGQRWPEASEGAAEEEEKSCSPFCQPCSSRSAEQDHAGPWEKSAGKRLLLGFFQQPDGCCKASALQGEAQTSFFLSHAIRGLGNDGV